MENRGRKGGICMQLSEAKVGNTYIVENINLPLKMEKRLEALGMTKDSSIPIINRKGNGILIVKIRGTRFAIGANITKNISVR